MTQFDNKVADLAHRPQNIEALQNAGVMALLRPLLLDTVPSIQQSAALALGRLANYSEELAEVKVRKKCAGVQIKFNRLSSHHLYTPSEE